MNFDRNIITRIPISIWEEDFSEVGTWLESLRAAGVQNLRDYLEAHPEALRHAVQLLRVVDVNQATLEMLEAGTKDELLANFPRLFTDETYRAFAEELIAIWEGRDRVEIELTGTNLKGNRIDCILHWVAPHVSGRLDLSNVIVAVSNMTERKRAEAALRESEERYRTLVETSPDAIWVEQHDRVVYVNPAGLRLLGYDSASELEGRSLQDLFEKNEESPLEKFRNIKDSQSGATVFETKLIRKDGKAIDVEVMFTETIYHGKAAIRAVVRDITEIKNLRQATRRMERLAWLGEFSATIAHEIRNPLGSIALNIQYLSERMPIPDKYQRKFKSIEQAIARTQEIIKGILDFARPQTPELKSEDLHKVLHGSLRSVQKQLDKAGVTVVKQFDATPPYVRIDATQMTQVFVNLFLNAQEAMPQCH
jgi:two-component system sporulation sensor kinase A